MGTEGDGIDCMICGERFRSVGHHVTKKHHMPVREYRERFGIRPGVPLSCQETRAAFAAAIHRTIDAGALEAHYAHNAERAVIGGKAAAIKANRKGIPRRNRLPVAERLRTVRKVIALVAEGSTIIGAAREAGIGRSCLHEWLKDFPAEREQLSALRKPGPIAKSVEAISTAGY